MTWLRRTACDDVDEPSFLANVHRLEMDEAIDLTPTLTEPLSTGYSFPHQPRGAATVEPHEVALVAMASR